MKTSYTKSMRKKIDLNDLFDFDISEDEPLILNVEQMDFAERNLLFDKLYQDYIILLGEKKPITRVINNYKRLLKEISVNYFN
tara:strand:- start:1042 stop:1290 length:249 start_codon:yes stop_codon:yes gene_type:complete